MENTYLESGVEVNIQPFHLQHHRKYNQALGKKPTKITNEDDNFWGDEEKSKGKTISTFFFFYNGGWSNLLMIQMMRGIKI